MMFYRAGIMALCFLMACMAWSVAGKQGDAGGLEVRKVASTDGVEIVYTIGGSKEPALVFIHGAFADRSFWANQLDYFAGKYRVIAIDLAGHGDSGKNRKKWDIISFANDVCAVLAREKISRAVLIGNSLGGPVALEAARLFPGKTQCIVAVDTFQGFSEQQAEGAKEFYRQQAAAYRSDFSGTMRKMVRALFHADADPGLYARVEQQMLKGPVEMAAGMMESFTTYDMIDAFKKDTHPIRCINGDLFQTQVEKNRQLHPDFDVVILPHTGHYPMLERPELFNRHLEEIVK
jgi:pimeloyl-ACP methyl ester carboxylesterase